MYGITPGESVTINQNEVYGLPSVLCQVQSSVAIESSMNGTTWAALTGANTVGASAVGGFIRCPTAASLVICKRY